MTGSGVSSAMKKGGDIKGRRISEEHDGRTKEERGLIIMTQSVVGS
jgi:hypothetical protein